MGTGSSRLGALTRDKLLKSTDVTRTIIDIIFEYLMENINLRDFYSLASPDKCRRYVLFTANAIQEKFVQIKIEPQKGKDGVIWFQSIKDLTNPPKSPIGTEASKDKNLEQQRLCLELAYFYIRIVQIYGALALTLIDDSNFMVKQGYTRKFFTESSKLLQPGSTEYSSSGPRRSYGVGSIKPKTGGGLYDKIGGPHSLYVPVPIHFMRQLGLFKCLRSCLYIQQSQQSNKYWIKFDSKPRGFEGIEGPDTTLTIGGPIDNKSQAGTLRMDSGSNYAIIHVTASRRSEGDEQNVTLTFNPKIGIYIKNQKSPTYEELFENREKNFYFKMESATEWVTTRNEPVPNAIHKFILEVWEEVKQLIKPGVISNRTEMLRREEAAYKEPQYTLFTEDRDVTQHLYMKPIIDGMTQKRRFGHCIARALQLLTTVPSLSGTRTGTSTATSSICDVKFSKIYVDTPTGTSLSDSASTSSLANLFYDTIIAGYPKSKLAMSDKTLIEYVEFIRQMSTVFMEKDTSEEDIKKDPSKAFSNISPMKHPMCVDDRKIMIDDTFALQKVYPHVQKLFRIQIAHAAECAKILVQLFQITKKSDEYKVQIHPNVLARGIHEIDRIAKIARNVLITYYSSCEHEYTEGVSKIAEEFRIGNPVVGYSDTVTRYDESEEGEEGRKKPKYVFPPQKKQEYYPPYPPYDPYDPYSRWAPPPPRPPPLRYYGGTRKNKQKVLLSAKKVATVRKHRF